MREQQLRDEDYNIPEILSDQVPEMSPVGPANHTIYLDGEAVHSWVGTPTDHEPLNWNPVKTTRARKLRIQSVNDKSWVDWISISIYVCD